MKRYNPGHYLQSKSPGSSDPADLAPAPGFTGVLVDIPWAALEPARGAYDFSLLAKYLTWASINDYQLIAMVFDRDFRGQPGAIVPRWLADMGLTTPFNDAAGVIANIWTPAVTDLRIALLTAIAREFDDHPRLEAIALPETGTGGITPGNTPSFTKEAYRDEIIRLVRAVAPAMAQTQLWQSMNWLGPANGAYLDAIAQVIEETGAGGITNPDSVPWEADSKPMYGTMRRFAGRVAVAAGGDTSQLGDPANNPHYRTLDELVAMQYAFGQSLGANYQLWNAQFTSRAVGSGKWSADYRAAVARLLASAPATVTTRPASLATPEPEPAPRPVDRELLQALLTEAESWLARARAVVG